MRRPFAPAVLIGALLGAAALAACGPASPPAPTSTPTPAPTLTPTPALIRPGQTTPQPTLERYRLDLGDGVVVAFDEHPAAEMAAYVTHVPTGAQVVLGRDGPVVERQEGAAGGLARIDATLQDAATMTRISAALAPQAKAPGGPVTAYVAIDWVPFIKFSGIMYIEEWRIAQWRAGLTEADLGPVVRRVAFRLNDHAGIGYRSQDGDSGYLRPGTAIYAVKGYSPTFRLATFEDGRVQLYQADTNPAASVGGDLLDLGGKVTAIGINSETDGATEFASVTDPSLVGGLVGMALAAPVDQSLRPGGGPRYFLAFKLSDGTVVTRGFWVEPGLLQRGIQAPPAFTATVLDALREAGHVEPTSTPTR